jgi:adenosylhomocysteine nucleosidase
MEDVVVFAALAWEARAVLDGLQGVEALGRRVWRGYLGDGAAVRVLQIGVGLDRAERAAADAAGARLHLSCGCAGALAGGLRAGNLVLADRIVGLDASGHVGADLRAEASALAAWSAARAIPVRVGAVASSPIVLSSPVAKRAAADTGALVVEMESAAVADAARRRGIPCTVVKVVLDEAGDHVELPGGDVVDPETGELDVARGVAALAFRPRVWPRAFRLAVQQRIAKRALRDYLAVVFSAGLDALGLEPRTPQRSALVG